MTHPTITLHLEFIRKPFKSKSDNWQASSYQWRAELITAKGSESFDFYTGSGWVLPNQSPKRPLLDDVLHSLVMDISACEQSFEDWAAELGYDTDSRKALDTYLACQANTKKLLKLGIDIQAERERLQDY